MDDGGNTISQQSERTPLDCKSTKWTKRDYIVLIFASLINFGDGIEINLPGVITQRTSCELALNKDQEGILGCVQYLTLFFSILTAGPLAD